MSEHHLEAAEIRFTFRLVPSEISALRALAAEDERTVGWEIRRAVREYLAQRGMTVQVPAA